MALADLANSLIRNVKVKTGLLYPELTPTFTIEQYQKAEMLHPSLSSVEVNMRDTEGRNYRLTYRPYGPIMDVSDSERNLPNLEFRSVGPASQVNVKFYDRPTYERLAAKINEIVLALSASTATDTENANSPKTHRVREAGSELTQTTTYQMPLTHEVLVALLNFLPNRMTDKNRLKPTYQTVPGSAYRMAEKAGLLPQEAK